MTYTTPTERLLQIDALRAEHAAALRALADEALAIHARFGRAPLSTSGRAEAVRRALSTIGRPALASEVSDLLTSQNLDFSSARCPHKMRVATILNQLSQSRTSHVIRLSYGTYCHCSFLPTSTSPATSRTDLQSAANLHHLLTTE
jgi:hypothetical protein